MVSSPKPLKKSAAKPAAAGSGPAGQKSRAAAAAPKANPVKAAAAKPVAAKPVAAKAALITAVTAPIAPAAAGTDESSVAHVPKTGSGTNAAALKKKDLIDRVLAATGARKKLVRDIVEATLTVLGDALSKGEQLNIPPFGKAKVSRPQEIGSRNAMTVKLRRTAGGAQGGARAKQVLADAEN